MTKVALAGSRDLPLDRTAKYVLLRLADLPPGSSVLLRHPKTKGRPPGSFERMCERIAKTLGVRVEWCRPQGEGRSQVYLRDLDMVTRADHAVTFFPTPEMSGGTGHVVEAAWTRGVAVQAWCITPDGDAERIGEYDPATDGP